MKHLVLVRHAKSSWSDWGLDDIDRPLNKRGKRDAPFMAKMIKQHFDQVDLFLVSPAKRAQLTSRFFKKEYPNAKIITEKSIYEAYVSDIEKLVHNIDDEVQSVMIFGHNPTFTIMANKYSTTPFSNLPTCGIAVIQFNQKNWSDFKESNSQLTQLFYPKQFLNR